MGCYTSRIDITAEEAAVMNFEMILGYSKLSAIYLDRVHRKYSYKGSISETQWKDICKTLSLAPSYSDSSQHIFNYYENYKDSAISFSLKKLLILGVLLGEGNSLEKGKLLFEIMDESGSEKLSSEQIQDLITLMVKISCEMNPRIFLKDDYNDVTFKDLEKYIAKLSKGKENIINKVMKKITKGCETVNIEDFLRRLSYGEIQNFFSAHGIRTYVKMNISRYGTRQKKAD
ncbi:hypothetical protein SteCoe_29639 [Stentor coeruleus]|uniref:EF-hand domain-containing protein n=1 Tax=Stentor coeruleus TaxID=5963 RepID=A0A1R2B5L1_9CILI|nr:hypothetical protein SteCoe_29639 [Stentor coeruleus]